jgi:hypothetical protein
LAKSLLDGLEERPYRLKKEVHSRPFCPRCQGRDSTTEWAAGHSPKSDIVFGQDTAAHTPTWAACSTPHASSWS